MTPPCSSCDRVHSTTRKASPFKWACTAHPRPNQPPPELLYVDPDWTPDPPYRLCATVRTGPDCPDYQPRRIPQGENE